MTRRKNGADVIVVGAGMAGLAVAHHLSARGVRDVLVLEAGADRGREHERWVRQPDVALERWLHPQSDPAFWRPYSTTGPGYLGISGLRRRIGGRSLYWHGVSLPMDPWALHGSQAVTDARMPARAWPQELTKDLTTSWEGGLPLYDRTRGMLEAWVAAVAGPAAEPEPGIQLGGALLAAVPQPVRRMPGGDRWAAYSPLVHWEPGSASSPPLRAGHRVSGIAVRSGTVSGVRAECDGRRVELPAAAVVLAAGTVENSRLLLQARAAVGASGPHRLTGLTDKLVHGLNVTADSVRVPPEMLAAARRGAFLWRPVPRLRSNLFAVLSVTPQGLVAIDVWLMGEQTCSDMNSVTCTPTTKGAWRTRLVSGLSDADMKLGDQQQDELRAMWRNLRAVIGLPTVSLGFDSGYGSPDLPDRLLAPSTATQAGQVQTYSFPLGAEQHEACTTPFGQVLGTDHQDRVVSGLYVTGPSVFPRGGAANPGMTVLALSERLAGVLCQAGASRTAAVVSGPASRAAPRSTPAG